jgi:dihydroxy-acid dehydratase
MGLKEEDFSKPKIAVVNSSSTFSECYIHLGDVSKAVQEAINQAGGLGFEGRTAAPSEPVWMVWRCSRFPHT